MSSSEASPPSSRPVSRESRMSMSIDLSNLPPLSTPTPPSNTLLITNLQDPQIFRADNIQTIKDLVNQSAPIHSWTPFKSMRRIIVSFYSTESAILIRQILDGESIMGSQVKIYFGRETPIEPKDEHLPLPDAGKLFFISPPPSPPAGWSPHLEDAPNKLFLAEDLAEALAKLHHRPSYPSSPVSDGEDTEARGRSPSFATTIYDPNEQGCSPLLPAISVEDMTEMDISPIDAGAGAGAGVGKITFIHTARPPVELME